MTREGQNKSTNACERGIPIRKLAAIGFLLAIVLMVSTNYRILVATSRGDQQKTDGSDDASFNPRPSSTGLKIEGEVTSHPAENQPIDKISSKAGNSHQEEPDLQNNSVEPETQIKERTAPEPVEKREGNNIDLSAGFPTIAEGETLLFEPGTLAVSKIEAFRQCHVPEGIYKGNFQSTVNNFGTYMPHLVSNQHRLLYYLIGKSASSSSRFVMIEFFNATNNKWPELPLDQYEKLTFTREPLDRFFSSFQELMFRVRPWASENKGRKNLPFPFLNEGLNSNDDWANKTLCDEDCYRSRFERFAMEHDPLKPVDVHVNLQAGILFSYTKKNGKIVGPDRSPLDAIYDTKEFDDVWTRIAASRNVTLRPQFSDPKRKFVKLFAADSVSEEAKVRVCHMVAIDYCCFNYELPPACQNSGIKCSMKKVDGKIQIGPENPPIKGGIEGDYFPKAQVIANDDISKRGTNADSSGSIRPGIDIEGLDPPMRRELPLVKEGTIEFEPGSLNLTRVETWRQCDVSASVYGRNYQRSPNREKGRYSALISDEYHLMYFLIGKSASSSNRWIMLNGFNASDGTWPRLSNEEYYKFSFTREPLDRFYSSFQESLYRTRPWGNGVADRSKMKYAYLYEGLVSNDDWYNKTICDEDCWRERFERFITEHDPLQPIDTHLHLQSAMLYYTNVYENGTHVGPQAHELDAIYDTAELDGVWDKISASRKVTLPKDSSSAKRKAEKLFDPKTMSDGAKRRICSMTAIDYCCLNYKLPEVCQGLGIGCKMTNVDGKTKIGPLSPPVPGGFLEGELEKLE